MDHFHLGALLETSTQRLRDRLAVEAAFSRACRLLISTGGQDLEGVLRVIAEAVEPDHAYLFRLAADGGAVAEAYGWPNPSASSAETAEQTDPSALISQWSGALCAAGNQSMGDVATISQELIVESGASESMAGRSSLVFPLRLSNGRLAGYLGFDTLRNTRRWRVEDGWMLRVVGEMIAAHWERELAEEQSRHRDTHFRTLVQRLNEVCSPREAARVVLEAADRLLGWDAAWLALAESHGEYFRPVLMCDQVDGRRQEVEAAPYVVREGGMTWRTIHDGAFMLNRGPSELTPPPPGEGFGDTSRRSASILCVPVLYGSQPVGTLSIQNYGLYAYREADLETLQTLADYCAGALKRCQAMAAQRESEEALRFAMKAARLGVWNRDLRVETTSWTEYGQVLPNGEPFQAEITHREFLAIVNSEDRERVDQASATAIRDDTELDIEFRMSVPGLGERWINSRGRVLRAPSGEPLHLIGIAEDITERKRLELALRNQEALLDAVLENLTEGVLASDLEGTLTYCNRAARTQYGVTELPLRYDEWIERFRCFHADGETPMPPEELPLAYAVSGTELRDVELVVALPNGEKARLLVSVHPMRNGSGEQVGVVATFRDITASRELEEQLRQSQKMEAIGRLAGGIAHDFNNLLAVVNGYSELSLMRIDLSAAARFNLQEIQKAGERAAGLTRQLLAFSRKDVIAPRVLDLSATVSDMHQMLRRLIGEDVELTTELAAHPSIRADAGQIEQVLLNLAVNARDAMPAGGRLTIRTDAVALDAGYAAMHPGVTPGRYARLSVSDTGHGMDPTTQKRVFEPFFTTKPPGTGTGLGLSTVYAIVKQWGGHIEMVSAPEQGATFQIYLPLAEEPAPRAAAEPSRGVVSGCERILLVEDDPMVRQFTRRVLEGAGYTLLEAPTPMEALRIATEGEEELHLLLTDVVMPQMNGRELAQRLTARRRGLRVLYMSGYTDDAVVRSGVRAAEVEFIQKPFSPAELANRVRQILDRP